MCKLFAGQFYDGFGAGAVDADANFGIYKGRFSYFVLVWLCGFSNPRIITSDRRLAYIQRAAVVKSVHRGYLGFCSTLSRAVTKERALHMYPIYKTAESVGD